MQTDPQKNIDQHLDAMRNNRRELLSMLRLCEQSEPTAPCRAIERLRD